MQISLSEISDQELDAQLKRLAARERELTFDVIRHLAELDRRRLLLICCR